MSSDPSAVIRSGLSAAISAGGIVPDDQKHLTRYPFLFLVDVSASTSMGGNDADIHTINQTLTDILEMFRMPPPGNELADKNHQIDFSVISYSDDPVVEIPWTIATNLPHSVNFEPRRSTCTNAALDAALHHIADRLRYYKDPANNIPSSGLAHIFHITDGAPTDFAIGTPLWDKMRARLTKLSGGGNPERQQAVIIHFITPNGCRIVDPDYSPRDEDGTVLTGQQALARLSGTETVYELSQGTQSMPDLIALVTHVVSRVTETFGDGDGDDLPIAIKAAQEHLSQGDGSIRPSDV